MNHGKTESSPKVVLLGFLLIFACASIVRGQTTSFTYQGRLTDGGAPTTGTYDLQFALWDSSSGGTQIGASQTMNAVAVSGGIFTVTLDFGVSAFSGADRFLEIGVRPVGGGALTILSPRQQISSTPYAIRTLSAASADSATTALTANNATQLAGVAASQYVQTNDSRLTDSRSPTAGSANYIQNTTSPQSNSNYNISGDGTAAGTLNGNVVNATTQFNLGGQRILSKAGNANLFAGVLAGQVNTSGTQNVFVGPSAGRSNTTGSGNSFFGSNAGFSNVGDNSGNGNGNSFFGNRAGNNNTGSLNSFFGIGAGLLNGTGSSNSFFGANAGSSNTSGEDNSFFGSQAGTISSSGARNTFIGSGAGNPDSGVEPYDSTAIGASAITRPCGLGAEVAVGSGANAYCGSTAIGFGAKATGIVSMAIGSGATASGVGSTAIGAGTSVSAMNTIQIGSNGAYTVQVPGALNVGAGISTVGTAALVVNGGLFFNTSGFLGVGTLSPTRQLDVNGQARIESIPPGPSAASVCFNSAGDLLQCGGSSLRWKRNIHPLTSGLNIVLRLRPISFNWKESGLPDIGLGAEEVAKVAPSFTFTNSQGEIAGVKYERLNILLINAVKEQQREIETLRKQNAALNTRLRSVEKALRKKVGLDARRR